MKKAFTIIILIILSLKGFCQTYLFDSIPDNLKNRATAVIRSDQCLFTILAPGKAREQIKSVVTLLNENSTSYRFVMVYYDKFSTVKYFRGKIYDQEGNIIKVLNTLDAFDMSAISGATFYSDSRVKILYFPIYKYPYTIEYEYEVDYSSLLNYPEWEFHKDSETSVEKSGIQVSVPKGMKLRYLQKYMNTDVDSATTEDSRIYTWQEENIPVKVRKDFVVQTVYNEPVVYTAPTDFEYGGIKGSMESWKDFGDWAYQVNSNIDKLSDNEVAKIKELTAGISDEKEMIRKVYEYMQSKTRYVSIDIGIGGYKATEALLVSKNGFGDCKGLVNYTKALLKAAGINSIYTLVKSGNSGKIYKDFVNNSFDHVILCVPLKQDTVWLECTNQSMPFNYLGHFTSDRYAMLVTPQGGRIVRTPSVKPGENIRKVTGSMFMNVLGAASGTLKTSYSGIYYDLAMSAYNLQSDQELKRDIISSLPYSDVDVSTATYGESKSEKPVALLTNNMSINDFITQNGSKMYFVPSLLQLSFLQDLPTYLEVPEQQIMADSVRYYLPQGYMAEYVPGELKLNSELGKYNYRIINEGDHITFIRQIQINKGSVPLEKFAEFRTFINTAAKKERESIILYKSNQ
jgi:hypothetical protein